jgi:hypothetical protein
MGRDNGKNEILFGKAMFGLDEKRDLKEEMILS